MMDENAKFLFVIERVDQVEQRILKKFETQEAFNKKLEQRIFKKLEAHDAFNNKILGMCLGISVVASVLVKLILHV